MMRKIILGTFLLFSVVTTIFSLNIRVKGRILQADNKKAVEYANIVLQTTDSVFVSGTISDTKGDFAINDVKNGNYLLTVSSIGYESLLIDLEGENKDLSLGDILLHESSISLEGVTITASGTTSRSDRKIVFPSNRQVNASTNGVDLLQQLMLPRIQVKPIHNEVSLIGGGEIQYRINGAKVEIQDIIALKPSNIIKIEFHDNPGLRYGNAEIVLDYIVYRPETGGNIGINLNDGITTEWGNNFINGKVNHKKSEFSMNYGVSHRNFYKMWRDNEEKFTFSDGSVLQRKEIGEPGRAEMYWQHLNSTYSYQGEKQMFSATLRYYTNNQPHWDYKGLLYNISNPTDVVKMSDRSSFKTHRPALDLYYQQNLKNEQTLVLNIVGTYNYTDNTRIYQESMNNIFLTDVNNIVIGDKYSLIGEGIYEKKIGEYRFSTGLKHTQSYADNQYKNGHNYTTQMNQAESFLYGELKGKLKKLDYTVGVGVTRSYFGQEKGLS